MCCKRYFSRLTLFPTLTSKYLIDRGHSFRCFLILFKFIRILLTFRGIAFNVFFARSTHIQNYLFLNIISRSNALINGSHLLTVDNILFCPFSGRSTPSESRGHHTSRTCGLWFEASAALTLARTTVWPPTPSAALKEPCGSMVSFFQTLL